MKKSEQNDKEWRTHDLYFAGYLQTAGVPMVRTEKENSRLFFIFDVSIANIEELKTAWFNSSGKVAALPYANNLKTLKTLCHM